MARRAITGVLLVGGASRRFGSPKALARLGRENLAERAWRVLGEACEERIAVGKTADRLGLPFLVVDDGFDIRAPLAGLVAGLREALHELVVFLPVDTPRVTPELLGELADACADAAVTQSGPLPAALSKRALPVLAGRLAAGELALRDTLAELEVRVVEADPALLANVNAPADLAALH